MRVSGRDVAGGFLTLRAYRLVRFCPRRGVIPCFRLPTPKTAIRDGMPSSRTSMERREFVVTAAAASAAMGIVSSALAQGAATSMHPPKYKTLQETAGRCVATGSDCLRHCLGMMAMKDTSMAGCADTATQLCGSLRSPGHIGSRQFDPRSRVRKGSGRRLHLLPARVRKVPGHRRMQSLWRCVQDVRGRMPKGFRLTR
jgi:hypothetical protein